MPEPNERAQALRDAEAAYRELRALVASSTADLADLIAARARFAATATAVADRSQGRERLLWHNYVQHVHRELRIGGTHASAA